VVNRLYPLTQNLFVASGGNVGIGTTTPVTKLVVKDGALTCNPLDDLALDVSTGSIYKGGVPFIHTRGGASNTAVGELALANLTSAAIKNTALGNHALFSNTTGIRNTANGYNALFSNTTGNYNAACGEQALFTNDSGVRNAASGNRALFANTTGARNTANGFRALYSNMTGSNNTSIGHAALFYSTGARNIALGSDAGISLTTGNAGREPADAVEPRQVAARCPMRPLW